ncbi:M20/M25/M40 family metallo-hydrolase [Actinomadura sp. B10D3]|uniref:M20/M25/M40 family metallo-hydrolase n=1 Tax=Actinomadura sp. B10D3 TaxID=3153557 RepID=UPI00325E24D8
MTDGVHSLKRACMAAIDAARPAVEALNDRLLRTPETGFNEHASARIVAEALGGLGLPPRTGLAGTGVKSRLRGRSPGPSLAILGELDAMRAPGHPFADPATGAAHTCGHHAQLASMLASAYGLSAVASALDGDVVFFAVPAEECIELGERLARRDRGEIEFIVGKPELIRLGEFDDVDLALMTHTAGTADESAFDVEVTLNGGLTKLVTFEGTAAHAASAPWEGVSALKAALLAGSAIDAHREGFRDDDRARVHWVLTEPGHSLTVVPDRVRMELMVRARTVDGLRRLSVAVDRALAAGAVAMGCAVSVRTVSGYLPYTPDPGLADVVEANARALAGGGPVRRNGGHIGGCSDVGDLAHLIPLVQPMAAGGNPAPIHGEGYWPTDLESAVITPAKVMAATAIDLLTGGAAGAKRIVNGRAAPGRDAYLALRRSFDSEIRFDGAGSGPALVAGPPRKET